MTREVEIEQPACEYAECRGWWTCKFTSPGLRGVPDRIFIRKGRVIFIEFKAPGEPASTQQLKRHREMREQLVEVFVIDNLEAARAVLR